MKSQRGTGDIVTHSISESGRVRLRVLGNDEKTNRVASFTLDVSWHSWNLINEALYNEREEIAQQHIPGTQ